MFYIKNSSRRVVATMSMILAIAFGLVMFISVVQAETSYDITNCYYGTSTMLHKSKELTIFSVDVRGIARSNHENKVFDNCSFKTLQIIENMNGKMKRYGHTKFMDTDGDCFFVEISGGEDAVVKFIHGTGKWKGITGTGKFQSVARGKSMEPGTFQGCVRNTGVFELSEQE